MTTAQDRRDIADGVWWRKICTVLGANLVGWTFRSRATIRYPGDLPGAYTVELDGRIAETIEELSK